MPVWPVSSLCDYMPHNTAQKTQLPLGSSFGVHGGIQTGTHPLSQGVLCNSTPSCEPIRNHFYACQYLFCGHVRPDTTQNLSLSFPTTTVGASGVTTPGSSTTSFTMQTILIDLAELCYGVCDKRMDVKACCISKMSSQYVVVWMA